MQKETDSENQKEKGLFNEEKALGSIEKVKNEIQKVARKCKINPVFVF